MKISRIKNVERVLNQYKDKITDNKRLILMYWKEIDGVRMNGKYISTQDFLDKATNPMDIISAKMMLEVMDE